MPIKDCPFSVYAQFGDEPRPILPVRIINPHTGKRIQTIGIIDTGAETYLFNFDEKFCPKRLNFGAYIGAYRPGFSAYIGGYKRYFLMTLYSI